MKGLLTAPDSAVKISKLYDCAGGRFNLNTCLWTRQLRDASDATIEAKAINTRPLWGNVHGQTMPWNPAWRFLPDAYSYVVLVDYTTGHSWEIWGHPEFRNDTNYSGATKIIQ